jgi:hypothetical protein
MVMALFGMAFEGGTGGDGGGSVIVIDGRIMITVYEIDFTILNTKIKIYIYLRR